MNRAIVALCAVVAGACSASRSDHDALEYFQAQCKGCSNISLRLNEDEVAVQTFEASYKDSNGTDKTAYVLFNRSTEQWSVQEK